SCSLACSSPSELLALKRWSAVSCEGTVAGAQTERLCDAGPVGACLAVRTPPAACVRPEKGTLRLGGSIFNLHQLCRFRPEAAKFLILRLVFVSPLDGFVVPPAGLLLVVQLPVGQGEEESVVTQVLAPS